MNKKLFATWRYDQFPYFLGGEVIELKPKGYCTVVGYSGMQFKYDKLYPLEEGRKLYEKVIIEKDNYDRVIKQAHTDALTKIKRIMAND